MNPVRVLIVFFIAQFVLMHAAVLVYFIPTWLPFAYEIASSWLWIVQSQAFYYGGTFAIVMLVEHLCSSGVYVEED